MIYSGLHTDFYETRQSVENLSVGSKLAVHVHRKVSVCLWNQKNMVKT